MKVDDYENAIRAKGLVPREVRLEKNQVKWFLCDGNREYDIIVFDRFGRCHGLPFYSWPEEVNDVDVRFAYPSRTVGIDGRVCQRIEELDLEIDQDRFWSETWGWLVFTPAVSGKWKHTCLRCLLWNNTEGQTEECIAAPPCKASERKDGKNGYFTKKEKCESDKE